MSDVISSKRDGLYFICCCSLHAHLKGIGMKFVVYRHAKESELPDELLMVSQSCCDYMSCCYGNLHTPMQAGKPVMLHNLKRDGELSANSCFLRTDGDESDRTGSELMQTCNVMYLVITLVHC